MKLRILIIISLLFGTNYAKSQEVIDQVVAVVGNSAILKSDIESQYIQMLSQNYAHYSTDLKCEIFEELLFQKLLLNQAVIDSVELSMKEVDTELNRRLSVFINQLGSEKQLEEFYNKTIAEIKDEFRTIIKDQLLTQKMQQQITSEVKISPQAVKNFYNSIPSDSLPVIPASYEFNQILIYPVLADEQKKESYDKLHELRERIIAGDKFETMAVLYSQDPGSAVKGGELGFVSREDLVPEFAEVAFSLSSTEDVSRIIESDFGYHIIKLIERRGELVNVRHILIVPEISEQSLKEAEKKTNDVYLQLINDSIEFGKAAQKYSDDVDSKLNNGIAMNPYTGNSKFAVEHLEPNSRIILEQLEENQVSSVFLSTDYKGKQAFKIVQLKRKVNEHLANLEDDFQEISAFAMQNEQMNKIKYWIEKMLNSTYIFIDDSYGNCQFEYADWTKFTNR
ncbi:MAG: peptidylprolyl isomerase [Bacteroidales bacterium]|nr:peptidylprolyl isomerase [Bacteroidales bacterium]